MPKADTVETDAPLLELELPVADALAALPDADAEPVAEALEPAEDEPPLLDAPPDAVPLPSTTEVFKQLVSEPAMIEAWAEKPLVPVLSLISALKLVPACKSTFQVKEVSEVSANCLIGLAPWEGMSVR